MCGLSEPALEPAVRTNRPNTIQNISAITKQKQLLFYRFCQARPAATRSSYSQYLVKYSKLLHCRQSYDYSIKCAVMCSFYKYWSGKRTVAASRASCGLNKQQRSRDLQCRAKCVLYKTLLKALWSRVIVKAGPLLENIKNIPYFKKKRVVRKMNGSIKENGMWGSRLNHELRIQWIKNSESNQRRKFKVAGTSL